MSAISWAGLETFTSPASTSTASSGDDWLRSFESSFALGISTSFNWPGSGGGSLASAGESLLGNARTAVADNSAVTGGFGNGFLLLNRNHISLHHIGSTWTGLVGHSRMVDYVGSLGSRSLVQSGATRLATSLGSFGTVTIAFPVPYSAPPFFVHLTTDTDLGYWLNVSSITTGGFTSVYSGLIGSLSATTLYWESDGT